MLEREALSNQNCGLFTIIALLLAFFCIGVFWMDLDFLMAKMNPQQFIALFPFFFCIRLLPMDFDLWGVMMSF